MPVKTALPGTYKDSLIDPDTLFKTLGVVPHSQGQSEYLNSKVRFNIPCCGRRYGKSLAAGHRMTVKAFTPNSYNWIVGPTYALGEKEFRVVWDDLKRTGFLQHCKKKSYNAKQGDMHIVTPWDSHIQVVSADRPDSLLGEGLSHVIMSEAARHNRETWEQHIEPALSDLRGSADFPSTPKGYNWYHGLWHLGQQFSAAALKSNPNSLEAQYRSWQFPTWDNTVRFPGGRQDPEILRIESTTSPHWFSQEIGASFTTMEGVIYEEFDETVHVIEPWQFNPAYQNFLAFDYGFANPFVALDIQVLPPDKAIVWREYYKSGLSTHEHGLYLSDDSYVQRVMAMYPQDHRPNPPGYRIDGMWGDPRGADEAATLAMTLGHVESFDVPWKHGVEEIKRMLKSRPPRLLISRNCTNLIRQMNQLRVKEIGRGQKFDINEMGADGTNNIQHKVDDHAADALRYFIGPYFAVGAGSHVTDIYGTDYRTSESASFVRGIRDPLGNPTSIALDNSFTLNNVF